MLSQSHRRRLAAGSGNSPRRSVAPRENDSDSDESVDQSQISTSGGGEGNLYGVHYEEMAGPPNAAAAEAMKKLVANREAQRIVEESRRAMEGINKAIVAVNDALVSQRRYVAKAQRRANGGMDDEEKELWGEDEAEERDAYLAQSQQTAESVLEKLLTSSMSLTAEGERKLRQMIDVMAETEDFNAAMDSAAERVRVANRQRQVQEEQEAEAERQAIEDEVANGNGAQDQKPGASTTSSDQPIPPFSSLKSTLTTAVRTKDAAYDKMTSYERYALNNDYAAFRRQLHNSIYEETREVPDKRRWFDEQGNPVLPTREALLGEESDTEMQDGSDEELVIQRVKQDFKCPLSLRELTNPYGTSKCIHVFEKDAIYAYVAQSGRHAPVQCPQSGCSAMFMASDLKLNQEMLIQLERRRQRRAQNESDDEGDQEDADEYEYASINTTAVGDSTAMKAER
ncbi:hypothetical protein BROUX41_004552 [Berkeleyomyces rouxiae]|uniref:uncharacterized protein n=1 Tax=Berkeleyomyces rouxiae TaxID=2035830 RepID=UPI003B762493